MYICLQQILEKKNKHIHIVRHASLTHIHQPTSNYIYTGARNILSPTTTPRQQPPTTTAVASSDRFNSTLGCSLLIALDVLVRVARIKHGAPGLQTPRRYGRRSPRRPGFWRRTRAGPVRKPHYRRGGKCPGRVPVLPRGDAGARSPPHAAAEPFVGLEFRFCGFQERGGLGVVVEERRCMGCPTVEVEVAQPGINSGVRVGRERAGHDKTGFGVRLGHLGRP